MTLSRVRCLQQERSDSSRSHVTSLEIKWGDFGRRVRGIIRELLLLVVRSAWLLRRATNNPLSMHLSLSLSRAQLPPRTLTSLSFALVGSQSIDFLVFALCIRTARAEFRLRCDIDGEICYNMIEWIDVPRAAEAPRRCVPPSRGALVQRQ